MNASSKLDIAEILYDSGRVRYRYARVIAPDGSKWLRNGLFVHYGENGSILSEGTYVKGKEEGLWRDFHPNGVPAAEGYFVGGNETGTWRFWSDTGKEEPSQSFPAVTG